VRLLAGTLLALAATALPGPMLPPPAVSAALAPRTSLTAVQDDLMCVACHEALAVSQSPQANAERRLIRHLIALGDTKAQIDRVMVAQYGPAVLARPPAKGFNLSVYILPPAAVALGLAVVGFAVMRWRRSARQRAEAEPATAPLGATDARRLDEELARFDG
jgi:cytochrome c-type biogenesis protein CcmH